MSLAKKTLRSVVRRTKENDANAFLNIAKVERALDNWARYVRDKRERNGKHLDIPEISIIGELYKFGHVIRGSGQRLVPENAEAMQMEKTVNMLRKCFPNLAEVLEVEYIHKSGECWNHKRKAELAGVSTTKYYELLFAAKTWLHGVLFAF